MVTNWGQDKGIQGWQGCQLAQLPGKLSAAEGRSSPLWQPPEAVETQIVRHL